MHPLRAGLWFGAVYLVLAGDTTTAELIVAIATAAVAVSLARRVNQRARVTFRPPLRWLGAIARAVVPVATESALLGYALARQLSGGERVVGADDVGRVESEQSDAMTRAIASEAYPGLTPNTLAAFVEHDGRVTGRRLLNLPGHTLQDDATRLS